MLSPLGRDARSRSDSTTRLVQLAPVTPPLSPLGRLCT